ncbi:hypothetical protein A5893_16480 [Pedobacter psychrophilus]|uniref:DUF2071 domain-containing protein n=2 Tax=Pedobacter psychrophilus TaxID=1826909 RepID=A0A179DBX7_9SPHI|nr:hypothetical protein A5893_16480 [Pedobacter psychrophilus]
MANYKVNAEILEKYVPPNTQLDSYNGNYYVSLIGFMFLDTRIKGIKIPFHVNFEEVNLRFYVKYNDREVWKRGAVFISEVVSKPMIALVANTLFHEHYEVLKTKHCWEKHSDYQKVSYQWKKKNWYELSVLADINAKKIISGSEEEFITEHYFGYTKTGKNKSLEYDVEHKKWEIYNVKEFNVKTDFEDLYGKDFAFLNEAKPNSVFLVEGSEILIRDGKKVY